MSDSLSVLSPFATGSGALQRAIYDSSQVKSRLDTLTRQAADGLVSDSYAGLGAASSQSLQLGPVLAHQKAWQSNIDAANARADVAQSALKQISSIASNFLAQANNLNGLDPSAIDSIAASARDALKQVANLLDTQDGTTFVFAGQDSGNAPVPNPDGILSSGFLTQISQAVGGLAANGAPATIATTLAIGQSNAAGTSPFSAALSQPADVLNAQRPIVQIGEGQHIPIGIVASANSDIASSGTSTTGSYTRDILRGLATLGSLSSAQANTPGFADVVQDVQIGLRGAVSALNGDAGVLGDRQSRLTDVKTTLDSSQTALQTQASNIQEVDMATTLASLSQTQTQLQESYQIIAALQGLSLSKYLSTSSG